MEEREMVRRMMKKQMGDGPVRDQLRELRIRPTYGNGILFQLVKKASEGDLNAAKYILGAAGEDRDLETAGRELRELSTRELREMLKKEE